MSNHEVSHSGTRTTYLNGATRKDNDGVVRIFFCEAGFCTRDDWGDMIVIGWTVEDLRKYRRLLELGGRRFVVDMESHASAALVSLCAARAA